MPWVDFDPMVIDPPPRKEAAQVLTYLAARARARFHADENFPVAAIELIRELGARVTTTEQAGLQGHDDESHAAYALRNGLMLLTCDREFLNNRRFPLNQCPAIFVFDLGAGTARDMMRAFKCLAVPLRSPQFYDKWCKFDAGPDCWTEQLRFLDGTTARHRMRLWRGKFQQWFD